MMLLESLHINRQKYGEDKGLLMGEIAFENHYAKFTVKLSEENSQKILALIGEQVKENAQELQQVLLNPNYDKPKELGN
jgi:hypothetical protein